MTVNFYMLSLVSGSDPSNHWYVVGRMELQWQHRRPSWSEKMARLTPQDDLYEGVQLIEQQLKEDKPLLLIVVGLAAVASVL